ncbi:hypothetical protein D3C78_1675890 [compost metagenome]
MLRELAGFLGVAGQGVVAQGIGHAQHLVQQQHFAAGAQRFAAQGFPGAVEPVARIALALRRRFHRGVQVQRPAGVENNGDVAAHKGVP